MVLLVVVMVPGGHYVVRQGSPHAHTLLLVDQQAVLLHLDVCLQLGLVGVEVGQRGLRLHHLGLQQLDALLQLRHLPPRSEVHQYSHLNCAGSHFNRRGLINIFSPKLKKNVSTVLFKFNIF